eukprot:COSAG06_NODE_48907_length_329_cov_0.565217_1_plen_66_part_10
MVTSQREHLTAARRRRGKLRWKKTHRWRFGVLRRKVQDHCLLAVVVAAAGGVAVGVRGDTRNAVRR